MTLFTPERRQVERYTRNNIRIDENHINSTNKWVTDRDLHILELLIEHPYLKTSQIEMMVFSDLKPSSWRNKCNERMRRLYHSHCVNRWYPPVAKDAGSSESHYVIDTCGIKILNKRHDTNITHKPRKYIPQTYQHSLKIFDFKAMLHVLNHQLGCGEIIRWKTEEETLLKYRRSDGRNGELEPDAFCIYKYTDTGRVKAFFLECDNATMDLEHQLKPKIKRYMECFNAGEWRQEVWARALRAFPAVVIVMHTDEDVSGLHRYICSLESNITFLLTTYDKLMSKEMKVYENKLGKKREVLQSVKVNILESIWKSNKEIPFI